MTLKGQHHLAPIEKSIHRVLDIATGTGIWAIEFASEHPAAEVIGTDLSPIQPEYVPANCSFQIDDAEDPWTFSQPFDYIHGRLLATCFKNFPGVVKQAFDGLRPGGYLELQDVVPTVCYDNSWEGSEYQRWISLLVEGGKALGMDWDKAAKYKRYLEEAGFVDVEQVEFAWRKFS
jgi:SAM-dependent methyltransferase